MTTIYCFPKVCQKHYKPIVYETYFKFSMSSAKLRCPECHPELTLQPVVVSDKYVAVDYMGEQEVEVAEATEDCEIEAVGWPDWLRKIRGV